MEKINIAIIGCGRISYKHVEGIVNNKDICNLTAVCDLIEENASRRKKEYEENIHGSNVQVYTDYKEMLDKEKIDMVTIATESGYHAEIAIYCMNKGKHVIVEKPMALSIEDADRMISCAKENQVKLGIAHQNRFNPPIKKLREAIDKKSFGKLINGTARILWNRNENYYKQAPWRGTWKQDGGTLMNQCIHNIDLLQWMMGGEIESVYSICDTFMRNIEGEDFGAILIRFKNQAIGIVEGSACVYPKNLEETLSVFGEKGTAVIGGLAVNEVKTWDFQEEDIVSITDDLNVMVENVYGNGHTPLFKDFIEAIKGDTEPLINGEEGKKAMSIVLAAYKSRLTGMPVKFPLEAFSTEEMYNLKNNLK